MIWYFLQFSPVSFELYTLHMYYMYHLLNYINIDQGLFSMGFNHFIG